MVRSTALAGLIVLGACGLVPEATEQPLNPLVLHFDFPLFQTQELP